MPEPPTIGSLEIEQDLDHERHEWLFERIGWLAMLLVIAAALAGLLGPGPLSSTQVSAASGSFRLKYDRFVHHLDPTELEFLVRGTAVRKETVRVALNHGYFEEVQIERVTPEPDRVVGGARADTFVFNARPGQPVRIVFYIMPQGAGSVTGRAVVGSDEVAFSQFIYP